MSDRLTLQDLIDLLSDKQGITKKDAEAFIRELVDVITETIGEKDFVRIKDFGIFKLVAVKARKSVDVNTGEAIEIAAHYKLSFAPDKVLREIVNRPFAHFESIILEEEIVFEDKEEKDSKKKKIATVAVERTVEEEKEEKVNVPIEEKIDPVVADKISLVTAPIEKEEVDRLEQEELDAIDVNTLLPEQEVAEETNFEPLVVAETVDVVADKSVVADGEVPSETVEESVSKPIIEGPIERPIIQYEASSVEQDEDERDREFQEYEYRLSQQKKKQNLWIGVGLAVILLLGVGYWGYSTYYVEEESQVPFAQNNPGIIISDNDDELGIEQPEQSDNITTETSTPAALAITETAKPEPTKEESGKVVEIQQGETMRSLGTKYYGYKAFWVYIFEENRAVIERPDAIQAGMKITLPPASKYGIDANDPESRKKADLHETKLFAEFSNGN